MTNALLFRPNKATKNALFFRPNKRRSGKWVLISWKEGRASGNGDDERNVFSTKQKKVGQWQGAPSEFTVSGIGDE
jgi:hypothetical protein